jgi:beta-xylosidase
VTGRRRRTHRRLGLGRGVAVLLLLLVSCSTGGGQRTRTDIPALPVLGPVTGGFDGDLGDPFLLTSSSDPAYIVFGTDDAPSRIPTATSNDLVHWTPGPDAFPRLPAWSAPDPDYSGTWAPAVLPVGTGFNLYLTVPDAAARAPCIAVATSASRRPGGPYSDALGHPLVCQPELGGSIDPSVVRGADGTLTLLWKTNGICCATPASLWAQRLRPDGLAVVGPAQLLLSAGLAWQRGVVEEPAAVPASRGGWWLFYSGDSYDQPGYAIGLAYCRSLTAPCVETADHPLRSTTGSQLSPGGLEIFQRPDGSTEAVFDTWSRPPRDGRYRCCRNVDIASLQGL